MLSGSSVAALVLVSFFIFGVAVYAYSFRRGYSGGLSEGYRLKVADAIVEIRSGKWTLFKMRIGLFTQMILMLGPTSLNDRVNRETLCLALKSARKLEIFVNGTKQAPEKDE